MKKVEDLINKLKNLEQTRIATVQIKEELENKIYVDINLDEVRDIL